MIAAHELAIGEERRLGILPGETTLRSFGSTREVWQQFQRNLGRTGVAVLCALAANGVVTQNTEARSSDPVESQPKVALNASAGELAVRECGDPPADAPINKQLRTMRCLHAGKMLNPEATSGTSLARSARQKSSDITKCAFEHVACRKPFDAYISSKFSGRGENLAWGEESKGRAQSIFRAWMKSKLHRKNILNNKWNRFGIALKKKGNRNYWVAHFGQTLK